MTLEHAAYIVLLLGVVCAAATLFLLPGVFRASKYRENRVRRTSREIKRVYDRSQP